MYSTIKQFNTYITFCLIILASLIIFQYLILRFTLFQQYEKCWNSQEQEQILSLYMIISLIDIQK